MSFTWPNKDPDEQLDYSVDWSRFLGTATLNSVVWSIKSNSYTTKTVLAAGETLAVASSAASSDTIQNVSQSQTSTVATINIGGGTANETYTFFCRIIDTTGSQVERTIKLRVKER